MIDWAKVEFPEGPAIKDKISFDKMKYLAEYHKLKVVNAFTVNEFVWDGNYCRTGFQNSVLRLQGVNDERK